MATNEKILYSNNAYSTLAAGINDVVTELTVQAGHGARFANPGAGECFIITLRDAAGTKMERCKCTTRSTDTFSNLTRGIDGTTAQNWASGDKVEIRLGKLELEQFVQQDGRNLFAVAGGSADALTAVFTPAFSSLVNGAQVRVRAAAANTTATPTFSPDGLTAKTIVDPQGNALVAGSIKGAGHELILRYNSTSDKWVLLNPYIPFTSYILTLLAAASAAAARAILAVAGLGDNNAFTGNNTHAGSEIFSGHNINWRVPSPAKTANYNIDGAADSNSLILADTTGGGFTVSLPNTAGLTVGFTVRVMKIAAGNTLTIQRTTAGLIYNDSAAWGVTSFGVSALGDCWEFQFDGADWRVSRVNQTGGVRDNGNRVYSASSMFEYVGAIVDTSANAHAHGLGSRPTMVQFALRCIDAGGEHGYAQNEETHFVAKRPGIEEWVTPGWWDATNVGVVTNTEIGVMNKSSFAVATVTPGKWNLVMRAWK